MDWQHYAKQLMQAAEQEHIVEEYIKNSVKYAQNLHNKGLPIIYDQKRFGEFVGYSHAYLRAISVAPQRFYRCFTIAKKTKGVREIAEPRGSLKEIQRWILQTILHQCPPSDYAKAFFPGRSIKENARFHRAQPLVLSLDLENFFASIKVPQVYWVYRKLGYNRTVAILFAKLCTLNGSLPQGAPTSPALSNLVSLRLDKRLAGFAVKNKIRYTRYADDLTFSGKFDPSTLISFVEKVLKEEKLSLNKEKIKLMPKYKRQEVTGIVVNQKLQAPRSTRRQLRQAAYYIKKYGLDSHLKRSKISSINYLDHLLGIANFILFVNPADKEAYKTYQFLANLK